jgi:hypothetical protein
VLRLSEELVTRELEVALGQVRAALVHG